jgi:hypothetical protein
MYNNPNWKWVIADHEADSETDKWFLARYILKGIRSFHLNRLVNYTANWTLSVQSNSKIQKWIVSRLSLNRTLYTAVVFREGELEQFLDELDMMMEVLYGKT